MCLWGLKSPEPAVRDNDPICITPFEKRDDNRCGVFIRRIYVSGIILSVKRSSPWIGEAETERLLIIKSLLAPLFQWGGFICDFFCQGGGIFLFIVDSKSPFSKGGLRGIFI